MTTIHTLHTTIQFPAPPDEDQLPLLQSFPFLWPDLCPQTVTWTTIDGRDPLLHPLLEYAATALDDEHEFRRHYGCACTFHDLDNCFLAARWINLTIEGVIAAVHQWMDVAGMLAIVKRDAPDLATVVQSLLQQVGQEQQRLLTLLAILQGVYFTYCQAHHVLPTLFASLEAMEGTIIPLLAIPTEQDKQAEEVHP